MFVTLIHQASLLKNPSEIKPGTYFNTDQGETIDLKSCGLRPEVFHNTEFATSFHLACLGKHRALGSGLNPCIIHKVLSISWHDKLFRHLAVIPFCFCCLKSSPKGLRRRRHWTEVVCVGRGELSLPQDWDPSRGVSPPGFTAGCYGSQAPLTEVSPANTSQGIQPLLQLENCPFTHCLCGLSPIADQGEGCVESTVTVITMCFTNQLSVALSL